MVTDFKETLEVKIVASARSGYTFKVTHIKIDLTFDEEVERSSFLCDSHTALDVIEGFVPTNETAKKAVYVLMKNGRVSLIEEY